MICELEQEHLDNPPKCLVCGKIMKPQYDSMQKRISGFIWKCECMPKGMSLMLLGKREICEKK